MKRFQVIMDDMLAFCYFFGLLSLVVFIIPDQFTQATKDYPYIMGFLKLSLLATFGEYLKVRMTQGRWKFDNLFIFFVRFTIWGIFGIWFTWAFAFFSAGTESVIQKGLWPSQIFLGIEQTRLWVAFSKSLFINIVGGYGWYMMLVHEYLNSCILHGMIYPLTKFAEELDKKVWFSFIPLTILLFWLPTHTLTFSLQPEWQVLMAAALSVALGFLLTITKNEGGN